MLSYLAFLGMAVCAVVIFIDSDPFYLWAPKAEPRVEAVNPPDPSLEEIRRITKELEGECSNDRVMTAIERVERKLDAFELTIKGQKHVVNLTVPDTFKTEIVTPIEVKGSMSLSTPPGKRLRVLHRDAKGMPTRKQQLEKVKKQIEGLSR